MPRRLWVILFSLWGAAAWAGEPRIAKTEPPFWWTGMANDTLELMLEGGPFAGAVASTPSPGITILRTTVTPNARYAFVTLRIDRHATPGEYPITLTTPGGRTTFTYSLRTRDTSTPRHQGFGPEDVVYLLMPDRFANGDTTNDDVPGMRERPDRRAPYGRHGGDLAGIIHRLDY